MSEPAANPNDTATTPQSFGPYAMLAEFEDVGTVKAAAAKVRDAGYVNWDLHSPFPIHGIEEPMGIKMTKLPLLTLAGALAGFLGGLFLVYWTNGSQHMWAPNFLRGYDYLISGKPIFSFPANVPVIFETTILLAAFATVIGLFALNRLPMLYNPLFKSRRFTAVTDDRFFIVIDADDPQFDETETAAFLESLGGQHIHTVDDDPVVSGGAD